MHRRIAELAMVCTANNEAGSLASVLVTQTARVKLWARVYEELGPDAIEDTAPLDVKWWSAILKCADPAAALEEALQEQLTTAQIKERWGTVKKRPGALYSGAATLDVSAPGKITAWLDDAEAEVGGKRCYITVKELK